LHAAAARCFGSAAARRVCASAAGSLGFGIESARENLHRGTRAAYRDVTKQTALDGVDAFIALDASVRVLAPGHYSLCDKSAHRGQASARLGSNGAGTDIATAPFPHSEYLMPPSRSMA
jgi:hypothetical protein